VHQQLRLVRLTIRGGGLSGTLETLSRPPPTMQPTTAALAPSVDRNEFLGAVALVIGGSRGLGEVTAKLIASGGGHVIVTYARGRSDAEAVAADINDWGGHCETAAYDVLQDAAVQMARLSRVPTHLYYFATPTIWRRKAALCVLDRFREFNQFYVAGFLEAVMAALGRNPAGIRVFYPSTVYVEERPAEMTEYAMSKAAGEMLCADLDRYQPGVRVLVKRLPRAATDQTGSVVPTQLAAAASVMLPVVRQMHRADAAELRA
jgi:NAD(P)-dependent dehydrogenase (short-subunit alcohol dehydrogenase family)